MFGYSISANDRPALSPFREEPFGSAAECVKAGSWENVVRMQRWFPDWRRSRAVIGKNRPKGRFFPTYLYVLLRQTNTTCLVGICLIVVGLISNH